MAQQNEQKDDDESQQKVITLDGKPLSNLTHIILQAWDASDVTLKAIDTFIKCLSKITGRRLHLRKDSLWLQNEKIHSKASNMDGCQARIPIIIGMSSAMFDRLQFKYDGKVNIITKVKYKCSVYMSSMKQSIEMVDNALIIAANDENIRQFISAICEKLSKQAKEDKEKKGQISIEQCFDLPLQID